MPTTPAIYELLPELSRVELLPELTPAVSWDDLKPSGSGAGTDNLLLEDGTNLLLETGPYVLELE